MSESENLTIEDVLERTSKVSADVLSAMEIHKTDPMLIQMTGALSAIGGLGVQWIKGIENVEQKQGVALTLAKVLMKIAQEFVSEAGING